MKLLNEEYKLIKDFENNITLLQSYYADEIFNELSEAIYETPEYKAFLKNNAKGDKLKESDVDEAEAIQMWQSINRRVHNLKNKHKALALLVLDKGEEYFNPDTYKTRCEKFQNLPLSEFKKHETLITDFLAGGLRSMVADFQTLSQIMGTAPKQTQPSSNKKA